MSFDQYRKLKKLVKSVGSFSEFINEAAKWPRRYGVVEPKIWTKADYQWFFEKIKGGNLYANIFPAAH